MSSPRASTTASPHLASSRRRRGRRGAVARIAALGAFAALAGCGDSTPTSPAPPPQPTTMTFAPEAAAAADSIGLSRVSSTAQQMTLQLFATDVTDLFGYAADLTFDPAIIAFEAVQETGFLASDGATTVLQVVESAPGRLVIGHARVGGIAGVSGTGALLTLTFTAVAPGTTELATEGAATFASDGSQQATPIFGGSVTVPG